MGNCTSKSSFYSIKYKQNVKSESTYEYPITSPRKNQRTQNLLRDDKEIPIIYFQKVDQIYPEELIEIFLVLEYNHSRTNYNSYKSLTEKIISYKNDQNMLIIFNNKEAYDYLRKLARFSKKLRAENKIDQLKNALDAQEFEKRYFEIRFCQKIYVFNYFYFKEVDKFEL